MECLEHFRGYRFRESFSPDSRIRVSSISRLASREFPFAEFHNLRVIDFEFRNCSITNIAHHEPETADIEGLEIPDVVRMGSLRPLVVSIEPYDRSIEFRDTKSSASTPTTPGLSCPSEPMFTDPYFLSAFRFFHRLREFSKIFITAIEPLVVSIRFTT